MEQSVTIAIVIGIVVLAALGYVLWQRRRTEEMRVRYGPEYDRAVHETGGRRRAEAELAKREERVKHLEIRPLEPAERNRFATDWRAVQSRFVDDPKGAISEADRLVEDTMKFRGYPVSDFDQQAADLSVHHPRVVNNYRSARDIAQRHRRGEATTEDLRQAMVYYRELFVDLLQDREHSDKEVRR